MIRVNVMDNAFNRAVWNARHTMPVEHLERPGHYGRRWREKFKCRIDPNSPRDTIYYIFDRDEDYTWFMLRWG
jgi:hypothetical protein